MRTAFAIASLALLTTTAAAGPKKKYHFELAAVTAKDTVKPDVAKAALPRVESRVKAAFAGNPQLVGIDGAPDRDKPDAYRKFLTAHGIAGAHLVTVEVTEASEELEPLDGKANAQRLVIHLGIHMLGENIPARTMTFTGDGQATIKQEVGMKLRDRDRQSTWDDAADTAVADAMKTVFTQLDKPSKAR